MTQDEEDQAVLASLQRQPGDEVAPMGDDNAAAAEGAAPAASGTPIVPEPDFGPPAPDATDAIAAGLPPAQGGIPTRDTTQDLVPGVPHEAPGNVGAPAPLPGQPGAPGAAATPPTNEMEAALAKRQETRDEADAAEMKRLEGEAPEVAARAEAAEGKRQAAEEALGREETIRQQYDTADKAAQTQLAQTRQALQGFKFKDYWADKTTGQKVLSSLSVMFGAFGAGLTGTANYALQILDKDMDKDRQQQVDHLKQLTDQEVMAATGVDDARLGRSRAMADIALADSQKDKMIAAQLDAKVATTQDENYKNTLLAKSAQLKERAAQSDVDAQNLLRKANLEAQLQQAKIEEERARAEKERAQAAQGGFAPGRGRAGAGHGGGSSNALSKFTAAATDGTTSMADLATLGRAAGLKPNQVASEVLKIRTEADKEKAAHGAAGRGDLMADRQMEMQARNFANEHQLPKLEAAHRKLEEVKSMMASGNPVAAMSALMEYDAAAKGSSATESSMHAIQGRLGGAWDRFKGAVARQDSGAFGETERKNLMGAIDVGLKAFKESVEPIHKAYYERFDGSKPGVKERAAGLFRPFGYQEKGAGAGGAARDEGKIGRARATVGSPNATPTQKANAAAYLQAVGEAA